MMDPRQLVDDAEAKARASGVSIQDLCDRAEVHRATWQRWKAGQTSPNMETWRRVDAVLSELA